VAKALLIKSIIRWLKPTAMREKNSLPSALADGC
jgi:hypothetical protein